ncbi:snf2 family helicase [Diplodia corticola]|uniref:Snf2 family helicase n=1 Tax=Diplodia corticola TaxID=236234 RepID=A0A1J9RTQ1_9PEZI|nr:snf2 family helicase [Diplodia corticola]OJD35939.1 snf2 family helicase [Diplodia corticola]
MDTTADLNDDDTLSAPSNCASSAPTPITSTSSSLTPAATSTQPSKEQIFPTDLRNYIPLGLLIASGQLRDSGAPGCWEELDPSQTESLTSLSPLLRDAVTTLLEARWIRVQWTPSACESSIMRLYVVPHDIARRSIDRNVKKARVALAHVVQELDVSADVWAGHVSEDLQLAGNKFDPWATAEDSSLFYLFNTLPSPAPDPEKVEDPYARTAMQDILDLSISGLRATLYPFQARSTALMLQRETSQELHLDPRLEIRKAPDGQEYYYCPRDVEFFRSPRWYESNRSGILAEGMGRGKTIIAISLILATKHHLPKIPPEYQPGPLMRSEVGSLFQMAAAATGRHSVPWRAAMARHEEETGEELTECIKALTYNPPRYEIPAEPVRFNRRTSLPPPRKMTMCSGTIVVVPRNLLHQWQSELQKHVEEDHLKVLVMDNSRIPLPPPPELITYDLVLFSRTRFEAEFRDGSNDQGYRMSYSVPPPCQCPYIGATRTRNCTCLKPDDLHDSPLKRLHWLRIMIDEGHNFSSPTSNAVLVAQKLVKAERRWVISGTPAKDDLLGVEVDLASNESPGMGVENDAQTLRDTVLQQRKCYGDEDSRGTGASKSLGQLATHFLQVRPWAETAYEERADWMDHVYRHTDRNKRRTFDAYSQCMKKSLEQLIIKTQPFDVERDLILPPLTHRVVKLEPSLYDKISANLFVLVLTANAVTSERTDIDYLFHPRSQQARNQLITNLRQSNFFWTGFSQKDIGNAIEHGCKYLVKEDAKCSDEDRKLLTACIEFAEQFVLTSENWKAMSATHEVGLFVKSWPGNTSHAWALGKDPPELYGVAQLLQAQAHINERLGDDPMEGFEGAGVAASMDAYQAAEMHDRKADAAEGEVKMGLPSSSTHVEVNVSKLHAPSKQHVATPKTDGGKGGKKASDPAKKSSKKAKTEKKASADTPRKRPRDSGIDVTSDSPLSKTQIIGTVSAKLTYLLGQVMTYHRDEKILVFYDGDNAAYYMAQCLDLLGVAHEIYSKGISNELRSKYIVNFDKDPTLRVLLMDVRLGALGLNVNKASRVYFINPVCRPSIEAQAVKRAHRIGQTKPVHVETLILSGTVEEAMFERSKAMTRNEHMEAKTLEDDQKITDIIKGARLMAVSPEEAVGEYQMAPLRKPEQLFGRPGRGALRKLGGFSPPSPKRRRKDGQSSRVERDGAKKTVASPSQERQSRMAVEGDGLTRASARPSLFGGGD